LALGNFDRSKKFSFIRSRSGIWYAYCNFKTLRERKIYGEHIFKVLAMMMGINTKQCLKLIQRFCCLLAACSSFSQAKSPVVVHEAHTEFVWSEPKLVLLFDYTKAKSPVGRGPASALANDEFEAIPAKDEIWLSNVFVEDSHGVMNQMSRQFKDWERMEEYRRTWDIGSTGLYDTPDREQKKAWFNRMILRYADKRFSGELKSAAQGSTLSKVRNVQQALRPNTEAAITKNFKLKFKARIIQMKAFMRIINPWVESETTFRVDGRVNTRISKTFKDLGLRTDLNFQVNDGHWVAQVSKPINQNVRAVLTTQQTESFDNTVQFIYSTPF
jgi:hypothetical protein